MRMKKWASLCAILAVVFVLLTALPLSVCAEAVEGVGQGNNGSIRVQVKLEDGVITQVEVLEHAETPGICEAALEKIPAAIVAENQTQVEAVSGATNTSKGIMQAVNDALVQAGIREEVGYIDVISREEMSHQENLDAWAQEWAAKMAQSSIEHAPQVKTLENGVKVQRVPADYMYWNTGIIHAEERGCYACHEVEDAMENLPFKHSTIQPLGTMELTVMTCLGCHRGYYEMYGDTKILDDAIHAMHFYNDNFDGNCLSCHQIDSDGNYIMWDDVKHDLMRGITRVGDVQGTFRYDQNVTTAIEDVFMQYSTGEIAKGIPTYAPDQKEVFENWEIRITGDVENPYTLKLGEIMDEELVTHIMTHRCVIENSGLISTFPFTGIRYADVLAKAVPKEGANLVNIIGKGYNVTQPLQRLMESEKSMLAIGIGEEPLPAELGYPMISIIEAMPASLNLRFVTEIVVETVEEPAVGNYDYSMYGGDGPGIHNNPATGIINVYEGQIFEYGEPIVFEGYADAFADTITCVKFSLDNGATWTKYDIPNADNDRWVYFWYELQELPIGSYVLTVSAETELGMVNDQEFSLLFHVQ